jgi:hypothetical protein
MTDAQTIDLLISMAEISGVFVGFGVLIGAVQSSGPIAPEKKALAQGVSAIGIVALLGALIPPTISAFGLSAYPLWFYSSIGFEVVIAIGFFAALSQQNFREFGILNRKRWPVLSMIFLIPLEMTLQLSLIFVLFGVFPEKANALYFYSIFINLAEAAMALTLLVFHTESEVEEERV